MALDGSITPDGQKYRTVQAAQELLNQLKPQIITTLAEDKLRVSLQRIDIMKPERRDPARAHVMWMGPSDGDTEAQAATTERLKAVCGELSAVIYI